MYALNWALVQPVLDSLHSSCHIFLWVSYIIRSLLDIMHLPPREGARCLLLRILHRHRRLCGISGTPVCVVRTGKGRRRRDDRGDRGWARTWGGWWCFRGDRLGRGGGWCDLSAIRCDEHVQRGLGGLGSWLGRLDWGQGRGAGVDGTTS